MQKESPRCDLEETHCMNEQLETRFRGYGALEDDAWTRSILGILHL